MSCDTECSKPHGRAPGPPAGQLFIWRDTTKVTSSVAVHNTVIGLAHSKSVINVM